MPYDFFEVAQLPAYSNVSMHHNLEQERNLADATLEDLMDNAFGCLQASLREELLEYLRVMDVYQFEEVVADLLKKMDCGDLGDVWVTKKSNDEGMLVRRGSGRTPPLLCRREKK